MASSSALLLLAVLTGSPSAWGRAGGGQNYDQKKSAPASSSSSRSSSSSSSSQSSSSSSSSSSEEEDARDPFSGEDAGSEDAGSEDDGPTEDLTGPEWALLVGVGGAFLAFPFVAMQVGSYQARRRREEREERARQSKVERRQGWATRLKRTDPDFELEAFEREVARIFTATQNAWSAASLKPVRRYLSDGVFNRFDTYLEMDRLRGRRNRVERLKIQSCELQDLFVERAFEVATVCIAASCWEYTDDLRSGKEGSGRSSRFTEWWTFLRRPGARTTGLETDAGRDGAEPPCPSCGATLDIGDVGRCGACGTLVYSGEYDWVLAEISQRRPSQRDREGLITALAETAPDASVQVLEDRASAIFWSVLDALLRREPIRAARLLTPAAREQLRQLCGEGPRWQAAVDVGVGQVELKSVERVEEGGVCVGVDIRWQAGRASCSPAGIDAPSAGIPRRDDRLWLRRQRPPEAPAYGLASAGCASCGGALDRTDQGSCPWCQQPIVARESDWLLEDIGFLLEVLPPLAESAGESPTESADRQSPVRESSAPSGEQVRDASAASEAQGEAESPSPARLAEEARAQAGEE